MLINSELRAVPVIHVGNRCAISITKYAQRVFPVQPATTICEACVVGTTPNIYATHKSSELENIAVLGAREYIHTHQT